MPQFVRIARRGRVLASLVGVLALVVALFVTAGTAGAGTTTTPPPAPPQTAAPVTTPTTPAATNVVAGTHARSATASLRTPTRCSTTTFRVTVRGRSLRTVTFSVAGRRIRTVTVPSGRRTVSVNLPVRRFGARRQSVTARVTFRNGARSRTLTASATRCAQGAVSPQFTG